MRIIARDSRRSERLGEDFLKVADDGGRAPWFLVDGQVE